MSFSGALGASGGGAGGGQEQQFVVQQGSVRRTDSQDDDLDDADKGVLSDQERFLPIANVARIMKQGIPSAQGKIAREARECVQECVSEFISFITSEASDRCQAEKRKTINGEDILFAMSTLGFDNYVEPLKLYLQKYRESSKGEKQPGEGGGESYELGEEGLLVPSSSLQHGAGAVAATSNQFLLTYDNGAVGQQTGQAGSIDAQGNFRPI